MELKIRTRISNVEANWEIIQSCKLETKRTRYRMGEIPHFLVSRCCFHHPLINLWWVWKVVSLRGFVKMLVIWCSVLTACIDRRPDWTCWQKWWYLMFKCFVRGHILGTLAIPMAPELSSKILQCTAALLMLIGMPLVLASCRKSMRWMIYLVAVDRAINLALVDDKAISVCSLDD